MDGLRKSLKFFRNFADPSVMNPISNAVSEQTEPSSNPSGLEEQEPSTGLRNLKPGTTYRLSVCGIPITRQEYVSRCEDIDSFKREHMVKVRHTMDQISRFSSEHIDNYVAQAAHPSVEPGVRASYAFNAVAWYTFFDPYAHPQRKHFFKSGFLLPILELSADAFYKHAVFVRQTPNAEVFKRMLAKHPEVASHYFDYAAMMTVARMQSEDLDWLTNW